MIRIQKHLSEAELLYAEETQLVELNIIHSTFHYIALAFTLIEGFYLTVILKRLNIIAGVFF